jgi:hypothetical protein
VRALPECSAESMKTVRYSGGGSLHVDAVAIAAVPASLGLASWRDTGERFVSYRCLVTPRADGRWPAAPRSCRAAGRSARVAAIAASAATLATATEVARSM